MWPGSSNHKPGTNLGLNFILDSSSLEWLKCDADSNERRQFAVILSSLGRLTTLDNDIASIIKLRVLAESNPGGEFRCVFAIAPSISFHLIKEDVNFAGHTQYL